MNEWRRWASALAGLCLLWPGLCAPAWAESPEAPEITIVDPAPHQVFDWQLGGISIPVTVAVGGGAVAPGALSVAFYLGGAELAQVTDLTPFVMTEVDFGRRQIAARLLDASGTPLSNPESLAVLHVRVVKGCEAVADCDEGNVCSAQSCTAQVCNDGPLAGCCANAFDCPFGYHCVDDECYECLTKADCDDGSACTVDSCDPSGACVHEQIPGCCESDGDCSDGDFCTADVCDPGTNTCSWIDSTDPLCCNEVEDCVPDHPCMARICYKSVSKGIQRCRFGPQPIGGCVDSGDCGDGNPCTLDLCDEPSPDPDTPGQCVYPDDPAVGECCLVTSDCDDGDPATLDLCVDHVCSHLPDPYYCALPEAPAVVLHELMPHPPGSTTRSASGSSSTTPPTTSSTWRGGG